MSHDTRLIASIATMQGRLIQDVRVAVFEFMLRKKRNSIAGAGYSQDIVKMGVARYTEADGTHEVTISKYVNIRRDRSRWLIPCFASVQTKRLKDMQTKRPKPRHCSIRNGCSSK